MDKRATKRKVEKQIKESDQRSDSHIGDRDNQGMDKYRNRCIKFDFVCKRLKKDILDYKNKISELEEKNRLLEDLNHKERQRFDSYSNECYKKDKIKDLINCRTTLESELKLEKQNVDHKNKVIKQLKQLIASNKCLVNNKNVIINKLKSEKEELNNQLLLKETTHSNEIKSLKEELVKKSKQINGYKDSYEDIFMENENLKNEIKRIDFKRITENNDLKKELKKVKNDSEDLKRQRTYFQNHNEYNKRRFMGVSSVAIKQRNVYRKGLKKVTKKHLEISKDSINEIINILENKKKETEHQLLKASADTCRQISVGLEECRESEKRILEKRSDGRILCGSCDQTFGSSVLLSQHMTVIHQMPTNPEQRDVIFVDEEEVICLN